MEKDSLTFYFDHMFDSVDPLIVLDECQRNVLLDNSKYLLVLAGAGSGKTTTMAAKVKYLIEIKKVLEKEILVLSFTRKATEEIRKRIQEDFGFSNVSVWTFHKLGYQILKKNKKSFSVITDPEKQKIFCEFLKENIKDPFFRNKLFLCFNKKYRLKEEYQKLKKGEEPVFSFFILKFLLPFFSYLKGNKDPISTFSFYQKHTRFKEKLKWKILNDCFLFYQKKLTQLKKIDFEDMISLADQTLSCQKESFPYRYLIIDEYQDISYQRFLLVKKLSECNDLKIMAVGDDFQAIFGFSGSQVSLFMDFLKYFPSGKLLTIHETYRNSQELIDVASHFILKNTKQLEKNLYSKKHLNYPVQIFFYKNQEEKLHQVIKIIKENRKKSILLMGRYQEDCKFLLESSFFEMRNNRLICTLYPESDLTFLTIHSAKGLGFEECILLNLEDTIYGFPSKIQDEKMMKRLKETQKEPIKYPEERRLFYVALTRTKHHIYLLVPKKNPSSFINELKKESQVLFH